MNKSPKLPSFEGLRGIAAFVVVLCHLRLTFYADASADLRQWFPSMPQVPARLLQALIEGSNNGTFAVWLFWIMSGFVLSLQFFLRAHQIPPAAAHDYLEEAVLRRYVRLLIPVLASVCFAYGLHRLGLMRNLALARALTKPEATIWVKNWYMFDASARGALKSAVWQCFFACDGSNSYNNVLWTMEPEFYGSLFLFSFLGLLGHRSSRFFAYLVVTLANHGLGAEWLNAFVAGIALCDLFVNRAKVPLGQRFLHRPAFRRWRDSSWFAVLFWLLIIVGIGLQNSVVSVGAQDSRDVFYLIFGVAAVLVTLFSRATQRVLASRAPMLLGRISFGLYLIHVPIICSFSCGAYLALSASLGHTMTALLVSVTTCLLSVILGYLLHVGADRPGVRWSRAFASFIMNTPDKALRRTASDPLRARER